MKWIEELKSKDHNTLYLARYIKFIQYYLNKDQSKLEYVENHHILPRSLFPEYVDFNKFPWNKCTLTGREHYIAHWMLWKAVPCPETMRGLMFSSPENSLQTRYSNPIAREAVLEAFSNLQKTNMLGELNPYFGKTHSEEVREKMSKAKKGKPNNSWNTGLTKDTSERLKDVGNNISKAKQGIRWWTNGVEEVQSFLAPNEEWYIGRVANENFKMSEERKQKMKETYSDGRMSWWNNGEKNKRQKDHPGEGWVKGRLLSKQHKLNLKNK